MKRSFLIFILSVTRLCLNGQNLIPNSDFEESGKDVTLRLNGNNNFTCNEWFSPSKGTPDYFTMKRSGTYYDAPKSYLGYLEPYSGNAYAGFATSNYNNVSSFEYLQIKLKAKLKKDQAYCLSLYLSPAESFHFSTNEIDFVLTPPMVSQPNSNRLRFDDYNKFIADNGHFEVNTWNRITSCYNSKGDEEYLIIGSITNKPKYFNVTKDSSRLYRGLYLFIDNVTLTPFNDSFECKCNSLVIVKNTINNYELSKHQKIILKNVNFEVNSANLLVASNSELDKLTEYLKSNPAFKIELIGHTDNSGDEKKNIKLSTDRAKSIGKYLINKGIAKKNINCMGLGSESPIKPNDTEGNRVSNRRVELKIVHNQLDIPPMLPRESR